MPGKSHSSGLLPPLARCDAWESRVSILAIVSRAGGRHLFWYVSRKFIVWCNKISFVIGSFTVARGV